jgi:hypothetical protein
MKTIIDQTAMRRRASLAHTASLGGLLVLLGSVAVSLWKPELTWLSGAMLFGGGAAAMVGIYFANRWVKKPRPEDILDKALKGLSDQHRLYHYTPYGDHLLLTSNGVVILYTINLEGQFWYQDGRWRQKMTMGRALRFLVEEKLGDPNQEIQQQQPALEKYLSEDLPADTHIPLQALIVFTHPLAEVKAEKSPTLVLTPDKLAKKIPHPAPKLPPEVYLHLRSRLDELFDSAD